MSSNHKSGSEREVPHSHVIQFGIPLVFIFIWLLDSKIFLISVWLNEYVPLNIRIIIFVSVLTLSLILIFLAHKVLFGKNIGPSDSLITSGILKYVRNPLYLGVLLIYVAFIILSISLISLILFVIICLIYDRMVNFEEKILEEMFGDKYLEYKKKVPKWIPNPIKKN
jgi:protein-S-isoprenylcysteine O-methyltransferase Ste14